MKAMDKDSIIHRYERESGNHVKDGDVFNDSGHFVCKFSKQLAIAYHENVMDAMDDEWLDTEEDRG